MLDSPETAASVLITEGSEGPTVTHFEAAATADPYVLTRRVPAAEDSPSQVITEYAPAPERPPSYPGWLPFLPSRPVFTTESPSGMVSPGARWACEAAEMDVILAALTEQSVAMGWTIQPAEGSGVEVRAAAGPLAATRIRLMRDDRIRLLLVGQAEITVIVQLVDVPAAALRT